ncbi:MAG TPA: tetratricopeptide repeat protein [Candidatus Cloacimonetes bacterium]|jgi:tetratricopeptide (TPR) repeat protein|nr:tetratricopeptide repeat protein [Candidatus Cloacimonadota bacterium]
MNIIENNIGGYMKPRFYIMLLSAALLVILLGACSGTKEVVPVEVPPTPMELANAAVTGAQNDYDEEAYDEAIIKFKDALTQYELAAPTAAETDSVDVKIEQVKLFMAKIYMDIASESSNLEIHTDAIEQLQSALEIMQEIEPLTIPESEKTELIKALYRRIAYAQQAAGLYEEALETYDLELAMDPDNEDILNIKYEILNDYIKDEARAIQVLKDYAETSQNYNAYLILGNRYDERKNFDEAKRYYEMALELNPNKDVLIMVANFYRNNGKWADSNAALERLVALKPEDSTLATVYNLIALNYNELKNRAKSVEYLEKALAIEPNVNNALSVAGYYHSAKNYNKTITYATMVLREDSNNSTALLLRGDSYFRLKRNSDAKADLQRIVNDRTHGNTAQQILKQIK